MTDEQRRYIPAPVDLLEALVESDECYFDDAGGCQAHKYLELEADEICPQAELKKLLEQAA